jgi:hypothetical protein
MDRNLKHMNTASGVTVTHGRNLKRTHEYSFRRDSHTWQEPEIHT